MMQVCINGIYSAISINDLYNIIDVYSKSFEIDTRGHKKCPCKEHFINKNISKNDDKNVNTMQKYLLGHYDNMKKMEKIYDNFLDNYPKISWLVDHRIEFNGDNNDYELGKFFQMIGYDSKNIFITYIKPQFNNLNRNQILIDSIFDTYLISNFYFKKAHQSEDYLNKQNYNKPLEDYKKFNEKKIITVLFTLDSDDYFIFEWKKNDEDLIIKNKGLIINKIKNKLIKKYSIEAKYIFNFHNHYKTMPINKGLVPDKIIKNIICELKKNKNYDKLPPFILRFFERIQTELSLCRNDINKQHNILNAYDNREYFMDQLYEIITDSIEDYLNIREGNLTV